MAHALAAAARPGSSLSESAHWVERAEALLGPAALRRQPGRAGHGDACVAGCSPATCANRSAALEDSGHEMAQAVLAGVVGDRGPGALGHLLDRRGPARRLPLRGGPGHDGRAQLRPGPLRPLDRRPLHLRPSRTPKSSWPRIVVALLEQIRTAVYARPDDAAPVVFALDEVAAIAPLPSLPAMAAEGGGRDCHPGLPPGPLPGPGPLGRGGRRVLLAVQPKLIFPGIGDHRTLQLISALAGEEQVPIRSVTRSTGSILFKDTPAPSVTTSVTWRPRMPVDEVARGRPDHALRIGAQSMHYVETIPWWHHPTWSAIARSLVPRFTETVRPVEDLPPETLLPSS